MTAAVLAGLGTHLPPRRVLNEELAERFNTSDEWIRSRTGIRQRRWADLGVSTGDLAVEAGHRALKSAGPDVTVDTLVLATTTPDHPCPATAPDVAARLGLGEIAAYDLSAVCSGFVYALACAAGSIEAGRSRGALVVASETYSTILNPEDRTTSVIFGDGAGAVVLRRGTPEEVGALAGFDLGSDGSHKDLIHIPAGGSRQRASHAPPTPEDAYFTMRGREVFQHAVHRMASSSTGLLEQVGWTADSVDRLVGHQANLRILHALADELGLDTERVVTNIERVGNTSAASIPLALADAVARNAVAPGDRVLLTAFGGGLTWGSVVLTWPDLTPA
ncbi:beta-ketoacyl-ACP synthase III [Streptomyces alkaliphilus]|uniref:Beta-ketoacyl-[acyl-carrier-protein] synthase III n=1 Tax=Streptomyces alkaliphilus TaxID=1472722 RepID=A0A7W3TDD4_9ACTN|nr:beta-ketoacyl-ACP synthase III [Streptomyces alkaliphilus]MBB0244804.1 beta-ketoacyl-ACP synthase III [Streptomyces alkaliphilus]